MTSSDLAPAVGLDTSGGQLREARVEIAGPGLSNPGATRLVVAGRMPTSFDVPLIFAPVANSGGDECYRR